MSIGNPAALWLLLLVAAFLLLTRNRTIRPRHPVGNLHLWPQPATATANLALRRMRRHWLVILQAAILTVIVMALARPTITGTSKRIALVIDVSSSMAAADSQSTRIEIARRAAISLLEAVPGRTRVRLIAAGYEPADLGEFGRSDPALGTALNRVEPGASSADLGRAIDLARITGVAAADIHVFSDSPQPGPQHIAVQWVTIGTPQLNRAITNLAVQRLPGGGRTGQLVATIANHGSLKQDVAVEILQAGRIVAEPRVSLDAHERRTIALDLPDLTGIVHARLRGDDALAADDERFAMLPDPRPISVRVIGQAGFFLERALAVNPSIVLRTAAEADQPAPGDVVVCDGCDHPPDEGRGVLWIRPTTDGVLAPEPVIVSRPRHPVSAGIGAVSGTAAAAATGAIPEGAEIVLRAGTAPAVIAYERGARRVVEVRLESSTGAFPLSPVFPVVLDNAMTWLAGRGENPSAIQAGEPLRWTLDAERLPETVTVIGPQGDNVRFALHGRFLTTRETRRVGLYQVRGDGTQRAFVVNPVTDGESDLTGAVQEAAPVERGESARPVPLEQTPPLILLAFALLATEWWARSRTGRNA